MRLLVIVSTDYGELGNALYFLQGLQLSPAPVVMVPASLAHALEGGANIELARYDDLASVQGRIAQFRPDVVLLFSGYLLTIGRRFSLLNAFRLLRWLRGKGIPVLTSDPFLGLVRGPATLDFNLALGGADRLARRMHSRYLALRIWLLRRQLAHCVHLYPAPIHRLRANADAPTQRGFFNPDVMLRHAADAPAPATSSPTPASWIFVLSEIDYRVQLRQRGETFVTQLAPRLREAIESGRRVVLIAPDRLLADVRRELGGDAGIDMRGRESYTVFMTLLMEAEYAFFWNLYSFSILHRVLARRAVMFFAEGHMVEILPALHEAGVQLFYAGWRPPLLALDRTLTPALLDAAAALACERFDDIVERLRDCPHPMTLLREAALSGSAGCS